MFVWNGPEARKSQDAMKYDRLSPVVKNPFDEEFEPAFGQNPLEDSDREQVLMTPTVIISTYSSRQNVKRQEFGFHSEFTVCDICGKNIKRNYIKDHIKTHDRTETKFQCEFECLCSTIC